MTALGAPLVSADASGRVFTGIALAANGGGYILSSASGEMYAYGTARPVHNPINFSGAIVDVALTADGKGAMAVSSSGQFYAYGTVRPQPNPRGFSGEIVAVAVTADGQGTMAISSVGQFYAYGSARPQRNPTGFSGRIVDVALTADGQGALAVSSAGQFYAYGAARPQQNPTGFTGQIVGADLTADGQGALAVSSIGQFYAYGTARPQMNPTGLPGQVVAADLTADGRGVAIVTSTGHVHTAGTARHLGNGDWGCTRYGGADVCLNIRSRYEALGGARGDLGIPTSHEFVAGSGRGVGMHFQGGSIYWSPQTGAWDVRGLIRDRYFAFGAENSVLGFPKTGEFPAAGGAGRGSHFSGGSIYWSPSTGAKEVHGEILRVWGEHNWENGRLGLPVTDELPLSNVGRISYFVGGSVTHTGSGTWAYVKGDNPDGRVLDHARHEAITLHTTSLENFMSVQLVRDTSLKAPLDWGNDGCSGPTYGDVDIAFREACLRHDFGARNFGPKGLKLDPSGSRLDAVNKTFRDDMIKLCDQKGIRRLNNNQTWRPIDVRGVSCKEAVNIVYNAVHYTATGSASPWQWW